MNQQEYIRFWDEHVEEYNQANRDFYRDREDDAFNEILSLLGFFTPFNPVSGKRVLDAGCGIGTEAFFLGIQGVDIYGIDASEKMISQARKNHPSMVHKFRCNAMQYTGFPDQHFDIIYSRYAIHCSLNTQEVFDEFARITKPGGIIAYVAPHPLLGFLSKPTRDYRLQEPYTLEIFDTNFSLTTPSHTFSDYLNDRILRDFELLAFRESETSPQAKENHLSENIPDFLAVKLRRRE